MEDKTPPAPPASSYASPARPAAEISNRTTHGGLRPKALDWWLPRVAALISSGQEQDSGQDYRDTPLSIGLRERLEREILIYDMKTSLPPVRKRLAQDIILLFLNLEKDHCSEDAKSYLACDQENLLKGFQHDLHIPSEVPSKRTKLDEIQITSIIRGLLEGSGGRVEAHQHRFSEVYSATENADLCALLFGITRTNQFGDFNPQAMCNTLSESPVFFGTAVCAPDVQERTANMMDRLRLGFRKGHLGLPSQVLNGFTFGQVDQFNIYLTNTYIEFPVLQKPGNSLLLLLTWSIMVGGHPINVLSEWVRSRDGWTFYEQMARNLRDSQGVEQLALTMAAFMSYRRLFPDISDHSDQPIKGSYLADLGAFLDGQSLGNSGAVAEKMVFSLIRVLRSFVDKCEGLIAFLETVIDRNPPLLHVLDGFSDQYLLRRISSQPHETAMMDMPQIEIPELRGDGGSDWVIFRRPQTSSETISPPLETEF